MKGEPLHHDLEFLVCRRRIFEGEPVVGASGENRLPVEFYIHPMAIQLTPRFEILHRFKMSARAWEHDSPVRHGISMRCAKVALTQVYHGIKASVDLVTMEPHYEPKFSDLNLHKNGVRVRNAATALRWTEWEDKGLTMKERQDELLRLINFLPEFCTVAHIKRFASEQGL